MPRASPLAAAFNEIEQLAQSYERPDGDHTPAVTHEEIATFTGLHIPDADLVRARDLQDLGTKANPEVTEPTGNFGRSALVDATTGAAASVWCGGQFGNGPGFVGSFIEFGKPVVLAEVRTEDKDAKVLAVTLLPPANQAFGVAPASYAPAAVVDFGIGGNMARAHIDYQQGQVIQVPASFLRVSARLDPAYAASAQTAAITALLGANIGTFPKSRVTPLTKSLWLSAPIAAGASARVFIPPFATQARFVYLRETGAAPNLVQILTVDFNGTAIASTDLSVTDTVQLPGNAFGLILFNNSAVNINAGAGFIFTIEL